VGEGRFCGTCGAPRSGLPPRFDEARQRFAVLKDRYNRGELDDAAYEAALRELIIQDEHGQYWMIGAETGGWYRYDGAAWIPQDPPGAVAPLSAAPAASAVPAARPAKQDAAAPTGFPWNWVAVALAVVLVLVLAAVAIVWFFPSILSFDLLGPTETPAPTATVPTSTPLPTAIPTVATTTPSPKPIIAPTDAATPTDRPIIEPAPTPVPTQTPPPGVRLYFPLFFR
jgi:hypothetical protein